MKFLNSNSIFPFAFGPENSDSRKATIIEEGKLKSFIDFTMKNSPECAAIAVIYDDPKNIPQKLKLHFSDSPFNIILEIKDKNGRKLSETAIKNNTFSIENLSKETKEIVFVCWRSHNENKKGEFIISEI